jgi:hypothetical protein
MNPCVHCGEFHVPPGKFCPNTGKSTAPTATPGRPPPGFTAPLSEQPTAPLGPRDEAKRPHRVPTPPPPIPMEALGLPSLDLLDADTPPPESVEPPRPRPRVLGRMPGAASRPHAAPPDDAGGVDDAPADSSTLDAALGASYVAQATAVGGLFARAFKLYQRHFRMFLLVAGALFVPGSIIGSCAHKVILNPTIAGPRGAAAALKLAEETEAKARAGKMDEEIARSMSDRYRAQAKESLARGPGPLSWLLALLSAAVVALIVNGFIMMLTQGALTLAVADRLHQGRIDWSDHWNAVFRRSPIWLSAIIPAAMFVFTGTMLFYVPGLVAAFFLTFVGPVAIVEGVGNMNALQRSYLLVRADWFRVLLVALGMVALNFVAHALARLLLPGTWLFTSQFVGDLVTWVLMPIPIIAMALVYLDLRQRLDGLSEEALLTQVAKARG